MVVVEGVCVEVNVVVVEGVCVEVNVVVVEGVCVDVSDRVEEELITGADGITFEYPSRLHP